MTETATIGDGAGRPYVAGDFLEIEVTVRNEAGSPVDISDCTSIRYAISALSKQQGPTGDALLTKSLGSGVAITNGPAGIFIVTIDSGDTDAMAGTYYHEAEIIDEGKVSTVFTGTISIARQLLPAL